MVDLLDALAGARRAWNDGYSIVGEQLNAVLDGFKVNLHIAVPTSHSGTSLQDCRARLIASLRAIRPYIPDLPSDSVLRPWSLGTIFDPVSGPNPPLLLGDPIDADGELRRWINVLRLEKAHWTRDMWNQKLIIPMEAHTHGWRQLFDKIEEVFRSMIIVTLANRETSDPRPTSGRGRGKSRRRKADYETINREAQIASKWSQARDAKVSKHEFAEQEGISLPDLELLLGRVSKRNARLDN